MRWCAPLSEEIVERKGGVNLGRMGVRERKGGFGG
jgi:hypothetical protein